MNRSSHRKSAQVPRGHTWRMDPKRRTQTAGEETLPEFLKRLQACSAAGRVRCGPHSS